MNNKSIEELNNRIVDYININKLNNLEVAAVLSSAMTKVLQQPHNTEICKLMGIDQSNIQTRDIGIMLNLWTEKYIVENSNE